MSTNGYVYTRGYKTTASPSWVDPLLVGSNDVHAVCCWTSDGDIIAAFATAADVVIINTTDTIRVGYASLAGGFSSAGKIGDDLYLGVNGAGVYRLAVPDCQIENGDLTPSPWTAYLSTTTTPALHSDNVKALYGWQTFDPGPNLSTDHLALATDIAEVVNLTDGAASHDASEFPVGCVAGVGSRVYWTCGNLVNVKYDAAGAFSKFDATVCGTAGDGFNDDSKIGWNDENAEYGGIVEQNMQLELDVTSDVEATARKTTAARAGYFVGDFVFQAKLHLPGWPTLTTNGQFAAARLGVDFGASTLVPLATVERRYYRESDADQHVVRRWATGEAADEAACTDDTLWIRLERIGAELRVGWRAGDGGPFSYMGSYTDRPTTPVKVYLEVECNIGGYQHVAHVIELQTGWASDTAYNGMPPTAIRALELSAGTSQAETTTVFAGFGSGLWGADTDESTPGQSEAAGVLHGAYRATGGAYNIIHGASSTVDALVCTPDAALNFVGRSGVGAVGVGTPNGLTVINLIDDTAQFGFDETTGQPLVDDDLVCLSLNGDWGIYGTANGGGAIRPDGDSPSDAGLTLVGVNGFEAVLGWTKPTEPDWHHSLLYRQTGSGAFDVLKTDGFGGYGSVVRFDAADQAGRLSFFDTLITSLGRYTYKVTQVDECGNESTGVTNVLFIDTPRVTGVIAQDPDTGSASVTGKRGVYVNVAADSGNASGNIVGAVDTVRIREQGQAWLTAPRSRFAGDMNYPFVLSAGAGIKTIEALAYSQSGLFGAAASTTIAYTGAQDATPAAVKAEHVVLAHHFAGDEATLAATNTNADFPAANLLDPRVGVKWRSANDQLPTTITFDLGGLHVVRYVAILGHNFAEFDAAYESPGDTWTLDLAHRLAGGAWGAKSISALAPDRLIIVNMNDTWASEIRLNMQFVKSGSPHGAEPAYFEIGRIVIVCQGANTVQPSRNFDDAYRWGVKEYVELHATPSARYAANPLRTRVATVSLSDFERDERRPWLRAYRMCGQTAPVLLILQPEILPRYTDTPVDWPDPQNRADAANMVVYGYFADDNQTWSMRGVDFASAAVTVEEAVE